MHVRPGDGQCVKPKHVAILLWIPVPPPAHIPTSAPSSPPQQQQRRYADLAANRTHPAQEPIATLKSFLEEFRGLFAQFIHQNSIILNMLSTLLYNQH
jgi:hypothetical protein